MFGSRNNSLLGLEIIHRFNVIYPLPSIRPFKTFDKPRVIFYPDKQVYFGQFVEKIVDEFLGKATRQNYFFEFARPSVRVTLENRIDRLFSRTFQKSARIYYNDIRLAEILRYLSEIEKSEHLFGVYSVFVASERYHSDGFIL